jgi:archaellum component FlaC
MRMFTERRSEKFAKKLIGRAEMEDALKRLDKLTQEEARMAAAQNLKATHDVDERVKEVGDMVEAVDNKVADVDDQVAGVSGQVTGVSDQVAGVSDQVAGVDDQVASVKEKVVTMDDRVKEIADDVDDIRRLSSNLTSADNVVLLIISGNQLRESTHRWLSPPDPSTNHNIACATHHKKTSKWFFKGRIYQEWKETGSLIWIHGKRLSAPLSKLTPSHTILSCSWLGQKCYVVRRL